MLDSAMTPYFLLMQILYLCSPPNPRSPTSSDAKTCLLHNYLDPNNGTIRWISSDNPSYTFIQANKTQGTGPIEHYPVDNTYDANEDSPEIPIGTIETKLLQ